jgi:hypothetical protein
MAQGLLQDKNLTGDGKTNNLPSITHIGHKTQTSYIYSVIYPQNKISHFY